MHTITLTPTQEETLCYALEQNIDELKALAYGLPHGSQAQRDVLKQIDCLNGVLELMERDTNFATVRRRFELAVMPTLFVNISSEPIDGEELTAEGALSALDTMPGGSNDYRAYGLEPQEYFEDWVAKALRELVSDLAINAQVTYDKLVAEGV